MTLDRRHFSIGLAAAGLSGALAAPDVQAQAQAPVEGVHYLRLEPPVPVAAGRIEVIEFFWYECPHCNAFEPVLDAWSRRLPAGVVLRRVPVWFQEAPFTAQQRLYYTIQTLGLVPTLHKQVFAAIHVDRARLRTPEDIAAFALKSGVDPIRFMTAYASPEVTAQTAQARQLGDAYKVDAVPAMGVQGRYLTNGNLANAGLPTKGTEAGNARLLGVVDMLIALARKPG